jgi:beta-xylosidase
MQKKQLNNSTNMTRTVSFSLLFSIITVTFGQNPIVPAGVYIADPSAHQWGDGKMYVYGSLDESAKYYCSTSYHVLSSSDLLNWTITPNSFATKGQFDKVPYSDQILYAPDCQFINGKYCLYYCLASNQQTEGVATSASPVGPFENSLNIDVKGYNEIDPCVFVDDDGQAYYIWGQFTAKVAKLKPNGTEIDSATIRDSVVTEKEHFFHEGGYMVKRNGIYYFVYAHMGRAGRPTCIGYATSHSPLGPFKYGGVIVDNDHCDPNVWNNHGSIAAFNGKWYVFYHRSTHGSNTMRKACVEPITFNPDGSINEVEMTTQGASTPLKAKNKLDAERACLLFGNVRINAISNDNEALTMMRNGDAAAFKYINFENGVDSLTLHVAPGKKGFTINIALDNSWGPSIGIINMPENGNGETYQNLNCKISKVKGVHALWLVFWGDADDLFKLDWLRFK